MSSTVWLDGAIRVNGRTWPVQLTDWIDGRTLNEYVDLLVHSGSTPALDRLTGRGRELVALMQSAEFAHCDLQHGNIIVDQYGQLRLVDYDGIWIPPFAGLPPPTGSGHRNYQHPVPAGMLCARLGGDQEPGRDHRPVTRPGTGHLSPAWPAYTRVSRTSWASVPGRAGRAPAPR